MQPTVLVVWLVCGIAAGMIGQSKRRSFGYYFAWGVLFGPIGVLVSLCVRPDKRIQQHTGPAGPGWYPADEPYERYWDGGRWTESVRARATLG
jgi:hypothetical protein